MKIQKLTLEGFRGFKDKTEFELHPNVNVFVGVNGSGKTSVLDAMGMLANAPKYTKIADLSIGCSYLNITSIILIGKDDAFGCGISSKKNEDGDIMIDDEGDIAIDNNLSSDISKHKDKIIYYETNRSLKDLYNIAVKTERNPFFVSDFKHFIEWYINEENNENREKVRSGLGHQNPRLVPMRKALERLFSKLEGNNYANLYVEIHKELGTNNYNPHLFIKKNGQPFKLDNLSDGEKMTILIVGDIARKLTVNYKGNKPEEILNESAIVLIDEIDLHLHPAWQRDIIPALTHVFPNVQFLVTTHSPQVLSNVKKESVHIIESFKRVPFTPSTFGADSNMILWDVFGVKKRPKHLQERLSEYYRALEKKDKDQVLKILEKIEEDYGADRLDIKQARMDFQFEYDEYLPKA